MSDDWLKTALQVDPCLEAGVSVLTTCVTIVDGASTTIGQILIQDISRALYPESTKIEDEKNKNRLYRRDLALDIEALHDAIFYFGKPKEKADEILHNDILRGAADYEHKHDSILYGAKEYFEEQINEESWKYSASELEGFQKAIDAIPQISQAIHKHIMPHLQGPSQQNQR